MRKIYSALHKFYFMVRLWDEKENADYSVYSASYSLLEKSKINQMFCSDSIWVSVSVTSVYVFRLTFRSECFPSYGKVTYIHVSVQVEGY